MNNPVDTGLLEAQGARSISMSENGE